MADFVLQHCERTSLRFLLCSSSYIVMSSDVLLSILMLASSMERGGMVGGVKGSMEPTRSPQGSALRQERVQGSALVPLRLLSEQER